MTLRLDQGTLRSPKVMPNGSLRVDGYLTRTGVFMYRNSDGTVRREYRPPDEVFRKDSLESAQLAPFTDDHPPGLISPENARKHQVGTIGENVRQDGEWVAAPIIVMDAAAIQKMRSGKHELSCGYDCDLDEKPGQAPSGERYDAVQRNIRYNHVALVNVARAGRGARVRMDGVAVRVDDESDKAAPVAKDPRTPNMTKEKSGLTLEDAANQVALAERRADAAEKERDEAKAELAKMQGHADGLKTRLDDAEKKLSEAPEADRLRAQIAKLTDELKRMKTQKRQDEAEAPEKERKAVQRRVQIEAAAASVLGIGERFDSLDNTSLMVAVVQRLQGVDCQGKPAAYVEARFDAAMEAFYKGKDALAALEAVTRQHGANEEKPSASKARDEMVQRNRNAWKTDSSQAAK